MQHHFPSKAMEGLAAASLSLLGSYAIATAPILFRGQILAPLSMLAGGSALLAAVGLTLKRDLTLSDFADGAAEYASSVEEVFRGNLPQLKRLPLRYLPPPIKGALQTFVDRALNDQEWRRELYRKSHLVCGVVNSGKTVFLHLEAADFIEATEGKGHLRVFDPNYGKRGNTWFGLPRNETVYTELDDLVELIGEAWDEMEKRRKATIEGSRRSQVPWKLIADEFNRSVSQLKDTLSKADFADFWRKCLDLIFVAHGYGVLFTAGVQTLAVGEVQLDRATQKQLNALLLGYSAIDAEEVSRIAAPGQTDELISRVKRLRRIPGGRFACVAKLEGQPTQVQVVPAVDPNGFEIALPTDHLTEEQRWARTLPWDQITSAIATGQKSRTQLWEEYGQGQQKMSNPYYAAFCELLNGE